MTPAKIFFQVARVLNLIYRLVVQPNTARAHMFAESFITCGGIETLLVLLQREAKAGDHSIPELVAKSEDSLPVQETELDIGNGTSERSQNDEQERDLTSQDKDYEPEFLDSGGGGSPVTTSPGMEIERMSSVSENPSAKNLGGINLSISADNARNNVYNVDRSDGIVVAIIGLSYGQSRNRSTIITLQLHILQYLPISKFQKLENILFIVKSDCLKWLLK
jgi:hypothetical protein